MGGLKESSKDKWPVIENTKERAVEEDTDVDMREMVTMACNSDDEGIMLIPTDSEKDGDSDDSDRYDYWRRKYEEEKHVDIDIEGFADDCEIVWDADLLELLNLVLHAGWNFHGLITPERKNNRELEIEMIKYEIRMVKEDVLTHVEWYLQARQEVGDGYYVCDNGYYSDEY